MVAGDAPAMIAEWLNIWCGSPVKIFPGGEIRFYWHYGFSARHGEHFWLRLAPP